MSKQDIDLVRFAAFPYFIADNSFDKRSKCHSRHTKFDLQEIRKVKLSGLSRDKIRQLLISLRRNRPLLLF